MMARMLGTAGGAVAGAYVPLLVLRRLIERRQNLDPPPASRRARSPGDLRRGGLEPRCRLDAASRATSGGAAPQLGRRAGPHRGRARLPARTAARRLQNLAKRTDLPAIRGVVNTLIQTERYGTPLAQALRVLAAEFREERMLKAEEKAARLPAIADRADDRLHPADAVRRADRPGDGAGGGELPPLSAVSARRGAAAHRRRGLAEQDLARPRDRWRGRRDTACPIS